MRDSNAPAQTGSDTDACELWPEDCHEDMELLADSQLAEAIALLESNKDW